METDSTEADCVQPAQETVSTLGTRSAKVALCLVIAMAGWPSWMVAMVGTGRHRGEGTLAGVEPAIQGPPEAPVVSVLETPMVSVPSEVALRVEPRMTPPNTAKEERHLHAGDL